MTALKASAKNFQDLILAFFSLLSMFLYSHYYPWLNSSLSRNQIRKLPRKDDEVFNYISCLPNCSSFPHPPRFSLFIFNFLWGNVLKNKHQAKFLWCWQQYLMDIWKRSLFCLVQGLLGSFGKMNGEIFAKRRNSEWVFKDYQAGLKSRNEVERQIRWGGTHCIYQNSFHNKRSIVNCFFVDKLTS